MPRPSAPAFVTITAVGLLSLTSPLPLLAQQAPPTEESDLAPPEPNTVIGPDLTPTTPPDTTPAPPPGPDAFEPRIPGAEDIDHPLLRALADGVFDLNLRVRYEHADIDGFGDSDALTLRTRLGYTTGQYLGFQAAVQLENNTALDDDRYNAAGLNDNPTRAVIADPEDSELNQLWIDYDLRSLESTTGTAIPASARVGRQRIILDDARFIGNVGWRQLEQTYDAAALTVEPVENVEFYYAYLWQVNRIFGPDADRDYDSDSHLFHLKFTKLPIGEVSAFAYLLDLEDGAVPAGNVVSSQTYGLRLAGEKPVHDDLTFGYIASAAWQMDYGDNPNDYGALYALLEGRLTTKAGVFGGLGFELLGSDDGDAAVTTPLATLHAFNGFADAFLVTPNVGLRDYYAFGGTKLPAPLKGKATLWYHQFTGDDQSDDLGWEVDAVASHKFNDYLTGLVKYAFFDGDSGLSDIQRVWVQMELEF